MAESESTKFDVTIKMILAIDMFEYPTVKSLSSLFGCTDRVTRNHLAKAKVVYDVEILTVSKMSNTLRFFSIGSWGLLSKEAVEQKFGEEIRELAKNQPK